MTIICGRLSPKNHRYEVTVPPAELPITLADLKIQTRIDWSDPTHDTWLTEFILKPVVECAEDITGLSLVTRTYKTYRDCFESLIVLEKAPFDSLVTFKYTNTGNVLGDVSTDDYYVLRGADYGEVLLAPNKDYPNDLTEKLGGIELTFTSGFGNAAAVKANLKTAMLQHATFFYQNRGDCCDDAGNCCPSSAMAIYMKNRIFDLSGFRYHSG